MVLGDVEVLEKGYLLPVLVYRGRVPGKCRVAVLHMVADGACIGGFVYNA